METRRARALMGIAVLASLVGVAWSGPPSGRVPAPCPRPALRSGVLVCDGAGDDVGDRAWLVGTKLDLNCTNARALERIAGIGPSLALKIITERDRRGGFGTLQDVNDVDGVGPKLLEKLSAVVMVAGR